MPRPIWNGVISFGLLNVPVQLYSAERSVDLHFRMLDSRNRKPIRYERVNADTGEEVPWKDVVKAFEYSKGNYVVVDEETLKKALPEVTETVEIEAFVDRAAIDPMYFEKPYYLIPGKKSEKGYVLLRESLKKTDKVGIAKVVIRTRQYLAMAMPHGSAIVLVLLRFPQEIVPASEFNFPSDKLSDYRINPRELKMATQLLESMTTEWKPDDYQDEFREKLKKIIDTRIAKEQGTLEIPEDAEEKSTEDTTNVVDFMSLLKKSLATKQNKTSSKPRKSSSARSTRRKTG